MTCWNAEAYGDVAAIVGIVSQATKSVSRSFGTSLEETENECWAWVLDNDTTGRRRYDKLIDLLANGRRGQALLAIVEGVGRNGFGRREMAHENRADPRDLDRRAVKQAAADRVPDTAELARIDRAARLGCDPDDLDLEYVGTRGTSREARTDREWEADLLQSLGVADAA